VHYGTLVTLANYENRMEELLFVLWP